MVKFLLELYDKGTLCHCSDTEHCWDEEDNYIQEIWHFENCEAKFKLMAVLSEQV